ncbi:DsrE family protein [Marivirga arenosa]|uniref:DsrE family protein n=1 Tax=Marivirga arenosa TaxID=3059076 RepID=A0AA51ZXB9_9BACT|nr:MULTISPECIES: DsrE family protein [unclassified Marivirga]WMN07303.1 DsrE family protein [Marivirga sp. ABR2-2]WNB18479.1 DsrE family protein [Marivirga sp. BKB1-2]
MKNYIFSSLLILTILFGAHNLNAQHSGNEDKINYVVITKKIPQLQPILLTAEALKAEDGENFGEFKIIICGKEIGDITDSDKINKFIKKADNAGVKIIACGFSLNKFKVDKTKIPQEIETVENGILYNFQLQKKGYKSITL